MNDYKYEIQLIAENIAENEYHKDFCDLTDDEQSEVFNKAEDEYTDRKSCEADAIHDAIKEERMGL